MPATSARPTTSEYPIAIWPRATNDWKRSSWSWMRESTGIATVFSGPLICPSGVITSWYERLYRPSSVGLTVRPSTTVSVLLPM